MLVINSRGKVYLENFVLSGVKQLQLNDIELRLINLRGDINITIPKLHLEGKIDQITLIKVLGKSSCIVGTTSSCTSVFFHVSADLNVRASLSILPLTLSCHIRLVLMFMDPMIPEKYVQWF